MTYAESVYLYLSAFVEELANIGLRHAVICPGSRSTPLTMRLADHPRIRLWLQVDERCAGYFALGMAKKSSLPVALVCTSGTATANFFPAVMEARYARVPLLILTADRPHELRDVGAPQTVDQIHLYGKHVKWFSEMAVPEKSETMLCYIRTVADRAYAMALSSPAGPVHLNFPFREPLVPKKPAGSPVFMREDLVHTTVQSGQLTLTTEQAESLAAELANKPEGLIICGPQADPGFAEAISQLAVTLDYPLLADPLSQVRCGTHDRTLIIDAYDAFLREDRFTQIYMPQVVLRFGAIPVSKPLFQYLKNSQCRHLVIDGGGEWLDPFLQATDIIHVDPVQFCHALQKALLSARAVQRALPAPAIVDGRENQNVRATAKTSCQREWKDAWLTANRLAQESVDLQLGRIKDRGELFEGDVFRELSWILPEKAVIFAGNSMPVRDLDTFYPNDARQLSFLANRGTNGIDGVISTALGASAVSSLPFILVIGDLSFFHDLNGLLSARLHNINMTVVLMNNDGGGIFSFLPQAEHPQHFEALFGTPLGLDYRHAADLYGGNFSRVSTWKEFRDKMKSALETQGLSIIEVPTQRQRNVVLHHEAWSAVSRCLLEAEFFPSTESVQSRENEREREGEEDTD